MCIRDRYKKAGGSGYLFRAATVQDFSAVTGACLLVRASVWDEVKGLDEKFAVAFNDVDFCIQVRDKGYRIVWTPYALSLIHILNGSGKSTLLKTIAGVYKPSKGKVTVNGTIAPLIELGAGFDMDLTARENIYLNGTVLGFSPK